MVAEPGSEAMASTSGEPAVPTTPTRTTPGENVEELRSIVEGLRLQVTLMMQGLEDLQAEKMEMKKEMQGMKEDKGMDKGAEKKKLRG